MTIRPSAALPRVLALMIVLGAGCGGGPPEDAAPVAAEAVALAPHGRMAALLPEVEGWDRGEVQSAEVGLPAPASHAATTYRRGDARIDLELTDTAGQAEYLEATEKIAGTDFERTSANGYIRGTTIRGAPAVESWNHVDRLAEVTVVVARRFVVHASASGLGGIDEARAFVEHVDIDALAALAPG